MRIALVRNHDECDNTRQLKLMQRRAGVLPHLGLAYISASLKKAGHEVKVVDAQALGCSAEELRLILMEFGPALVGVTSTTPGFLGALEACRAAKSCGAVVILGGPHTEVFTHENLYHQEIDFVGVGEGASIMPELAKALEGRASLANVRGLIGREISNPAAEMLSLSDIGWPDRDDIPAERYHSVMAKSPFTTMISSRGCPFQCSFCFKQAVDKRSMFRPAADVVEEMQEVQRRSGIREIMFYDDVFTMKRKRVVEICEEILRRKLKVRWEAPTRVDLVDRELLELMHRAGCIRLRFGIESGSRRILEHMHKSTDLETITSAVLAARAAGIQTFAYFIVGYLDETEREYEETMDLALSLPLDYASFYAATPLPGTRLFRDSVSAGLVDANYWHKFIREETTARIPYLIPDAEMRARGAYRRFYLRSKMLPTLAYHMAAKNMFLPVASGLAALLFSRSNFVRDT